MIPMYILFSDLFLIFFINQHNSWRHCRTTVRFFKNQVFHAVCHIGTMPGFVHIETCFFGDNFLYHQLSCHGRTLKRDSVTLTANYFQRLLSAQKIMTIEALKGVHFDQTSARVLTTVSEL